MPMNPDELHAKSRIAAAIIEQRYVGLSISEQDLQQPWMAIEQLRRLQKLTQMIYEAISATP